MNTTLRPCFRNAAFAVLLVALAVVASFPIHAQTYSVVVDFSGQNPQSPAAGPAGAQARDGNFYSTTVLGGTNGFGTIFKITPSGTLTTVYNFDGTAGQYPDGGLTLGADGNLYGTTNRGGSGGFGTVFKITTAGVITTLHTFTNAGDGTNPATAPLLGLDGNFYGTTTGFNVSTMEASCTIYRLTPSGVFSTIHTLDPNTEGSNVAFLTQGSDGNLYGTAWFGGTNSQGTIFRVSPSGNLVVLHQANGSDGEQPDSLVQAANGAFYGTAYVGGTNGTGTIFKITTTGAYTKLRDLVGVTDGSNPIGPLVLASDGNIYGTSFTGGAANGGTIFRLTPAGAFTKQWDFDCNSATQFGCNPQTGLFQSTSGLLYGSTLNSRGGVFYSWNTSAVALASLVSTAGKEGAKIGILGQGFSNASVVKFAGVQAITIQRSGNTFILATVPNGALTGTVTVTTGPKVLTTPQTFHVKPTILSFSPASGPVGTPVVITGTGLTQTMKVSFGGVAATTFTLDSDTQVTATVPTGAVTGKIVVQTKGGSVTSATSFTVN